MGGRTERGGWGGRWQKPPLDVHTVANNTSVGHTTSGPHSQWEQIQVPTVQLAPSMAPIVPVVTLEGQQNALEKSRPVNIQHLIHWECIDIECACKLWQ